MAMRVGELAKRTGVGVSTLRAWETRFRFLEPQRSTAGHRLYDEADVERVNAVLRLVGEGLTLAAAITRVASVGTDALPEGEAEALLYGQILQVADQGVWVSKDGRTRYVNQRMAEIMGYSVDDLVKIPVFDFFLPDEIPEVRERAALVRAGNPVQFTQRLRRSDGSFFWAEVSTTPLLNQAGRYEGGVALVQDVTDRNEAETQTRLRTTLLESIGEAVTASTPDGRVVYVNAAAERLFGWRAADVIGRESRDVFPAPEDAKLGAQIVAMLGKGQQYSGRYKMARLDGSQFIARLTSTPALDAHGNLVGFVGVISDRTEHDQLEQDVRTRALQAETLALLGVQVLRQRADLSVAETMIVGEAVETCRRVLHADQVTVLDVGATTDDLQIRTASPPIDAPLSIPSSSQSFAGYVTLARKMVVVDNTEHDRRFDACSTRAGASIASAVGAPIFGPDGLRGVLTAESSEPGTFDQGDGHFLQGIANIIGTALLS
ncbi:MAG: hypothetical protein QOH79_2870 [Acidimicrobiaceae bacterium]